MKFVGIAVVLSLALLLVTLLFACAHPRKEELRLLLHNRGKVTTISQKSPQFKALQTEMETTLTSAPDMFRLAVQTELIADIKSKQVALELLYPAEKSFTIVKTNKKVTLDRLLIPLTGDYAEAAQKKKFVTLFYGVRAYGSGPYTNDGKHQDTLRALLAKAGHKIP